MKFLFRLSAVVALILQAHPGNSSSFQVSGGRTAISECDTAAKIAARETSIPLRILLAVTRTETGRGTSEKIEPWPWALNVEGKAHWFANKSETLKFLKRTLDDATRSVDVGCFQLNYIWHGDGFNSLEEMLDPVTNARYAASFLSDLYRESGDWRTAVGMYHSRTEIHATKYLSRYEKIFARLDPSGQIARGQDLPRRKNNFPLLRIAQNEAVMGSLVPLSDEPRQSLFSQ